MEVKHYRDLTDDQLGRIDRERFWSKVAKSKKPHACWLWGSAVTTSGHGRFAFEGKTHVAHRVAYILTYGAIDSTLTIDHLCRVRNCVNPAHMEQVTAGENTLRGNAFSGINARKTQCNSGHPLSGKNLIKRPLGWRACRECQKRARHDHEARKRQRDYDRGVSETTDKIRKAVEGLKRTYKEDGNLSAMPSAWELSVLNWNGALDSVLSLLQ